MCPNQNLLIQYLDRIYFFTEIQKQVKNKGFWLMALLNSPGKNLDVLSELVTFINLRGDANVHKDQRDFLFQISKVNVIFFTGEEMSRIKPVIEVLKERNCFVLCVIQDKMLPMKRSGNIWRYGIKDGNRADITDEITSCLKEMLQNMSALISIENITVIAQKHNIKIDQNHTACIEAQSSVQKILHEVRTIKPFSSVKKEVLPLQGQEWINWCVAEKEFHRPNLKESESIVQYESKIQIKMDNLRREQQKKTNNMNFVIKIFVEFLQRRNKDEVRYFLRWMNFELNSLSRKNLSVLQRDYDKMWTDFSEKRRQFHDNCKSKTLTKEDKKRCEEQLKKEGKELADLDTKLQDSSLGLEHCFRELAQIYECNVNLVSENNLASSLPRIAANILIQGQPMELMDGDAGGVPCKWLSAVFSVLSEEITPKNARIFVLTVLGIQSTGKSTLLNAMFGLELQVSAGRCTRGAYMQLLKVHPDLRKHLKYDFILVLDTEGLRAPETADQASNTRDNEIATLVIGLGDLTIINIFGENPSDMSDVLEIVIQAFLRMKQVNIKPKCYFVHQNVGAVDAKDKLQASKRKMMAKLNSITSVAAERVGRLEKYFNEVISFDEDKHIFYLTSLWQGDPPMAPPNPGYSERIQMLKSSILEAPRNEEMDCLRISDFSGRIKDLWNSLLSENFVFNFKNSVEITAYNKLESQFSQWKWDLTEFIAQKKGEAMKLLENKQEDLSIVESDLGKAVAQKHQEILRKMSHYFSSNDQKHVTIKWETQFKVQMETTKEQQLQNVIRCCAEYTQGAEIRSQIENATTVFLKEARNLAETMKTGSNIGHANLICTFNKAWEKWKSNCSKTVHVESVDYWARAETFICNHYKEFPQYCAKALRKGKIKQSEKFELCQEHISSNWKGHFKFWGSNAAKDAQNLVKRALEVSEQNIYQIDSSQYTPKTDKYFMQQARDLDELTDSFSSPNAIIDKKFNVDMLVVILNRTATVLENLHENYVAKTDPNHILEKEKPYVFDVFRGHVTGLSQGMVAANMFTQKLSNTIWDCFIGESCEKLASNAKTQMEAFSSNRANLDLHVRRHLVKKGSFNAFMKYILTPQSYIQDFTLEYLQLEMKNPSGELMGVVVKGFENLVIEIFNQCKEAHQSASYNNNTLCEWSTCFGKSMGKRLSLAYINNLSDKNLCNEDFAFFRKTVSSSLDEVLWTVTSNLREFVNSTQTLMPTLEQAALRISEFFTEDGCWEKCPFCKEVCTMYNKGHPGDHSVMFHKPQGISGWYYRGTKRLVLPNCSSCVKAGMSFYNEHDVLFPYRNYRTAGPQYEKWSITTDDSMLKYWQWFCGKFEKDIVKYHGKETIDQIPNEWKNFTETEVLEELKNWEAKLL